MRAPGSVMAWGLNSNGEIARGENQVVTTPALVVPLETKGIVQLALGKEFSLALDQFGNVRSWGRGLQGQLGLGEGKEKQSAWEPTAVGGPEDLLARRVVFVAADHVNAAAVTEDGELFEWGLLTYNPPPESANAASLEMHGLAQKRHNVRGRPGYYSERLRKLVEDSTRLYLTSTNEERVARQGELVAQDVTDEEAAARGFQHDAAPAPATATATACVEAKAETEPEAQGEEGVVNLRVRRRVFATPQLNESLAGIKVARVALGAAHVAVLTCDGAVLTRGYNDRGQLGTRSRVSRAEFARVTGDINQFTIVDLVCGNAHCLALTDQGQIWSWGTNSFGQLGLGPQADSQLIPVPVTKRGDGEPLNNVVQLATGDYHSLCLTASGEVLSWGHSEYGQHGNAQHGKDLKYVHLTRHFFSPRPVPPFTPPPQLNPNEATEVDAADDWNFVPIKSIASNARYSLAVDLEGRLWSWGWNGNCVLGQGEGARFNVPRIVEDLAGLTVLSVAAGPSHASAIVEQPGSHFALTYAPLMPPLDLHKSTRFGGAAPKSATTGTDGESARKPSFDVVLWSRLTDVQKREKNASLKYSVAAHQFVLFSRCPALKSYFNLEDSTVRLPFSLQPLVLQALVEYLYCDHIRSCPPHRVPDLRHLGKTLGLQHLVDVCAFTWYQRALKEAVNDPKAAAGGAQTRRRPVVGPSTFSRDMRRAAEAVQWHNVVLATADDGLDLEDGPLAPGASKLPPGHTSFSWRATTPGCTPPPGHTPFSLAGGGQAAMSSAHLDILCRYPFFETLLTGSFKEANSGSDKPVVLQNLTPRGLGLLLDWLYCGDREQALDPGSVMAVLATARCFGIEDLANECERYIFDNVDAENVAYVREFAEGEDIPRLLRRCQQVSDAHA